MLSFIILSLLSVLVYPSINSIEMAIISYYHLNIKMLLSQLHSSLSIVGVYKSDHLDLYYFDLVD
jgi:hypothetical protein